MRFGRMQMHSWMKQWGKRVYPYIFFGCFNQTVKFVGSRLRSYWASSCPTLYVHYLCTIKAAWRCNVNDLHNRFLPYFFPFPFPLWRARVGSKFLGKCPYKPWWECIAWSNDPRLYNQNQVLLCADTSVQAHTYQFSWPSEFVPLSKTYGIVFFRN